MTMTENINVGNKISRISKKRDKPIVNKARQLKKNWRLVQLMTALEEYQGLTYGIDTYKTKSFTLQEQQNYKNEVIYKNIYITNPLVPMTLDNSKSSVIKPFNVNTSVGKKLNSYYQERFPISAKFVAQWLSENIVSSKTYKLTLLCDRVIKAAKLNSQQSKSTRDGSVKLVGIKIIISGRILGAEIATSKTFKAGQIPSNTIDILKDSGFALAKTRSGTIGIKVIYFWKS